jgi:hypothetical protein
MKHVRSLADISLELRTSEELQQELNLELIRTLPSFPENCET